MMNPPRRLLGALVFPLFIGASLVGLGTWFALGELGMPLAGIDTIWPVFPLLGGCLFYLGFLVNPRAFGLVFPGTLFFLAGLFFLSFSLGVFHWDAMEWLWPVFPLILGLAFVALFAASLGRNPGLLVPAGMFVSVGIVGLAFTATPFASLVGIVGWPLVFLAAGASLVLFSLSIVAVRVLRGFGSRSL